MGATYINRGNANGSWGTMSVPLPDTYTAGNIFILVVNANGGVIPDTPTGWTLLSSGSYSTCAVVFYKIVTSSESSPSISNATAFQAVILQFSGVDVINPIITQSARAAGNGVIWFNPITTTKANQLVLSICSYGNNGYFSGWDGSSIGTLTEVFNQTYFSYNFGTCTTDIAYGVKATAGSTGFINRISDQYYYSAPYVTFSIALNDAPLGKKINGITCSKWNGLTISKYNGV